MKKGLLRGRSLWRKCSCGRTEWRKDWREERLSEGGAYATSGRNEQRKGWCEERVNEGRADFWIKEWWEEGLDGLSKDSADERKDRVREGLMRGRTKWGKGWIEEERLSEAKGLWQFRRSGGKADYRTTWMKERYERKDWVKERHCFPWSANDKR